MRVEHVPLRDPAKKALTTGLEKAATSKVVMLVCSLRARIVTMSEALSLKSARLGNNSRSLAVLYH